MRSSHAEKLEDSTLPERPQRFSVKQTEFLHAFSTSPYMTKSALCREVGIPRQRLTKWENSNPSFKKAMQAEYRRSQIAANMNRKTVLNGMLKAIEMAEDKRQPATMISGWKEVARMCGYYEPEKREILLSVDNRQLMEQIQTLPKAKLLELWHEHEAVEGEFEVVDQPDTNT